MENNNLLPIEFRAKVLDEEHYKKAYEIKRATEIYNPSLEYTLESEFLYQADLMELEGQTRHYNQQEKDKIDQVHSKLKKWVEVNKRFRENDLSDELTGFLYDLQGNLNNGEGWYIDMILSSTFEGKQSSIEDYNHVARLVSDKIGYEPKKNDKSEFIFDLFEEGDENPTLYNAFVFNHIHEAMRRGLAPEDRAEMGKRFSKILAKYNGIFRNVDLNYEK